MADRHTTRHRTIRGVDDELWEQASHIARVKAGDTDRRGALSAEIRAFLTRYVRSNRELLDVPAGNALADAARRVREGRRGHDATGHTGNPGPAD